MRKLTLIGIFSMLLMTGCKNNSNDATHEKNETEITSDELQQAWNLIELNGTQKWLVNEEMKPYVKEGEKLVNDFINSESKDYQKLGAAVTAQNNKLIKSCTMDGKSHDELHNWLHPHLEITKALAEEDNEVKAKELIDQLQESYRQYHQFFN